MPFWPLGLVPSERRAIRSCPLNGLHVGERAEGGTTRSFDQRPLGATLFEI